MNAPLRWPNSSALEQRLRDGAAVHRDERGLLARRERGGSRAPRSSLPVPRLAAQQHGGLELGDLPQGAKHLDHAVALGHDLAQAALGLASPDLAHAAGLVLAEQALAFLGLAQQQHQLVGGSKGLER